MQYKFNPDFSFTFKLNANEKTPKPWSHILANPFFGTLITANGGGFTWNGNAQDGKLSTWTNNVEEEPRVEDILINGDSIFNGEKEITYGFGYVIIKKTNAHCIIWVPLNRAAKVVWTNEPCAYLGCDAKEIETITGEIPQEFHETCKLWENKLEKAQGKMKWLLYQTLACRLFARTSFYQCSGAYGFRDQLQDSLALIGIDNDLVKQQILLHASHQYIEGDVQHWFFEDNRGIRTRFSDDLLWLPYTVAEYTSKSKNFKFLEEKVVYLHSKILDNNEQERYEKAEIKKEGSLKEHCERAIALALSRISPRGLPYIGSGDWNDGMNMIDGESVWLAWFMIDVLNKWAKITGDYSKENVIAKLTHAANSIGWDETNGCYHRAFYRDGTPLQTFDSIAQSWAVLSGAGEKDKCERAMKKVINELIDKNTKIIKLLTPPFEIDNPRIAGYICAYPPGARENGGQYTHECC